MRGHTVCMLALAVLLVGAAGVQGHASTLLRGILGKDAPGSGQTEAIGLKLSKGGKGDVSPGLTCPDGQTLKIGTLDAAQNPSCVKCGGWSQFACNGSKCVKGLTVLDTPSCVQPLCILDATNYKPRTISKTASGKNFDKKAAAATFSVTKGVQCGILGAPCCGGPKECDFNLVCKSNTCGQDDDA